MDKSFDTDRLVRPPPGELVRLRPEIFHAIWARWLSRRRSASRQGYWGGNTFTHLLTAYLPGRGGL